MIRGELEIVVKEVQIVKNGVRGFKNLNQQKGI